MLLINKEYGIKRHSFMAEVGLYFTDADLEVNDGRYEKVDKKRSGLLSF